MTFVTLMTIAPHVTHVDLMHLATLVALDIVTLIALNTITAL